MNMQGQERERDELGSAHRPRTQGTERPGTRASREATPSSVGQSRKDKKKNKRRGEGGGGTATSRVGAEANVMSIHGTDSRHRGGRPLYPGLMVRQEVINTDYTSSKRTVLVSREQKATTTSAYEALVAYKQSGGQPLMSQGNLKAKNYDLSLIDTSFESRSPSPAKVRKGVATPGNTKRKSIPWPSDSPQAPTKSFAPRTAPAALRISRPSTTSVLSPTSTLNLSNPSTILPIRGSTPHQSPPSPRGRRSSPHVELAHQGGVPGSNLPVAVEDLRPPSCARGTRTSKPRRRHSLSRFHTPDRGSKPWSAASAPLRSSFTAGGASGIGTTRRSKTALGRMTGAGHELFLGDAHFTGENGMRFRLRSDDSPRHPRVYVSWIESEIRIVGGDGGAEDPYVGSLQGVLEGLQGLWDDVDRSVGDIRSSRVHGQGDCVGLVEQYAARKIELSMLRQEIVSGGVGGWNGQVSEWFLEATLLQRLSLRQGPLVRKAISHFWAAISKGGRFSEISKYDYVRWSHKAARALLHSINFDPESEWAEIDWEVDTDGGTEGGKGMTEAQFTGSLFDLADNWLENLSAESIVGWLGKLWVLMYTEDGVLRDDKEIVCDDLFWSGAYDGVISNPRFAVPAPEGMRNMGVATQRIGTAGVGLLAGRQAHLEAARATKDANQSNMEALSKEAVVGRGISKGGEINWDTWKPNLKVPEGGVWAKSLKKFAAGVLTSGGKSPVQIVGALATRHKSRIADKELHRAAEERIDREKQREKEEKERLAAQRRRSAVEQAKMLRLAEDGLAKIAHEQYREMEPGSAGGAGAVEDAAGAALLPDDHDEADHDEADKAALEAAHALEAYFAAESSRGHETLDAVHGDQGKDASGREGVGDEGVGGGKDLAEEEKEEEEDETVGRVEPLGLEELRVLRDTSHMRPVTPLDLKGLKLRLGLVPINPHAPPPPRLVSRYNVPVGSASQVDLERYRLAHEHLLLATEEPIEEDIHAHLMKKGKSFMELYEEKERKRRERDHAKYKQRMVQGSDGSNINTSRLQTSPPQQNAQAWSEGPWDERSPALRPVRQNSLKDFVGGIKEDVLSLDTSDMSSSPPAESPSRSRGKSTRKERGSISWSGASMATSPSKDDVVSEWGSAYAHDLPGAKRLTAPGGMRRRSSVHSEELKGMRGETRFGEAMGVLGSPGVNLGAGSFEELLRKQDVNYLGGPRR